METTNCTECGTEIYLIAARGDIKHLCLDCGAEWMRANGHQNDLDYVAA